MNRSGSYRRASEQCILYNLIWAMIIYRYVPIELHLILYVSVYITEQLENERGTE